MKTHKNKDVFWGICIDCQGRGNKRKKVKKKARLQFQVALDLYEKTEQGEAPLKPKGHLYSCLNCNGSGLTKSETPQIIDKENYPHVAIVGAGIGGIALAVACLHRGIPFTLYERDKNFNARSQGYGLTLQQASKAIKGFGLFSLKEGVVSTRHIVHNQKGDVIGQWGMRKWRSSESNKKPKTSNIHIARQSLRLVLLKQLGNSDVLKWNHKLVGFKKEKNARINLSFKVNGIIKNTTADLLVGADGIRSTVRQRLIGDKTSPLQYLGCIVILGICYLKDLEGINSDLLDSATVFQTVNGNERIYMMPYAANAIMWQLSYKMLETEAKSLSSKGPKALKIEACNKTQWHDPIPQIMEATTIDNVSGYPIYDRELLDQKLLKKENQVTLIGDAAHPMSPFKGQGANQALLDALALARSIAVSCKAGSGWRENGIRKNVLNNFELEMLKRSASKVKDSATAANLLHSKAVLNKGDAPRGRNLTQTE